MEGTIESHRRAHRKIRSVASNLEYKKNKLLASFSGVTSNAADLTVEPVALDYIQTAGPQEKLGAGDTEQISATAYYTDDSREPLSPDEVIWSSFNAGIVSVDETGLVKAESIGFSNIFATYDGVKSIKNILIEVTADKPPPPPTHTINFIRLSPTTNTIKINGTVQLTATAWYTDGTFQDITDNPPNWYTTDAGVATVVHGGKVTGKGVGTAKITCKTSAGVVSQAASVTVK